MLPSILLLNGCGIGMKNMVKLCASALRRICNGKPVMKLMDRWTMRAPKRIKSEKLLVRKSERKILIAFHKKGIPVFTGMTFGCLFAFHNEGTLLPPHEMQVDYYFRIRLLRASQ